MLPRDAESVHCGGASGRPDRQAQVLLSARPNDRFFRIASLPCGAAHGRARQGLTDLTTFEGTYTFHAIAVYGEGCRARRDITWAADIEVGIDGDHSDVRTDDIGGRVRVTVTPRDRFPNRLGPGRLDALSFVPTGPGRLVGDTFDNGDGSYSQTVDPGPTRPIAPEMSIAQEDRPRTPVLGDVRSRQPRPGKPSGSRWGRPGDHPRLPD